MSVLKSLRRNLKNLSPATIREIIAVAVILCIAVALSLPQFFQDMKTAKLQQEVMQNEKR